MREEGGFTLPEVLVAMTLMVVVFFALYAIFDMTIEVFGFGNDLDGNRKIECPPPPAPSSTCEIITYDEYRPGGSTTDALGRARSSGGVRQPVAGYVRDIDGDGEALTFDYLDRFGDPTTSEAEVAMVRIELEVGVNGRAQTLSTQVALRNRMQ